MSNVHYCFIARDSDMVVFEILMKQSFNVAQFQNEVTEILVAQEKIPEGEREQQTYYSLDRITGETAVECHMLFNVAFFGIITDLRYDKDKARRYLDDLYAELNTMYRKNIQFIKRQQNLKPFVYNQPFKASFDKVHDRYKTNISMGNVNAAQQMTDEIKDIARESLKEY